MPGEYCRRQKAYICNFFISAVVSTAVRSRCARAIRVFYHCSLLAFFFFDFLQLLTDCGYRRGRLFFFITSHNSMQERATAVIKQLRETCLYVSIFARTMQSSYLINLTEVKKYVFFEPTAHDVSSNRTFNQ